MHTREPGQLLGGKYRLIRLLGQGGMGSVWHAQHLTLNAPVALKFIDSERLEAAAVQRFLAEARLAAALRSPHVVQILDYGVEEETPHIAMELLEGETLAARLKRQGSLDLEQTTRVVQHVSRAIARAHDAGVIHRDLKPENVFIVRNDDDELLKVLDFGIAKSTRELLSSSAAASTRTGALLGTPYYMSPEQVDGDKSIDVRTDLWSLGVVVYQCLLGALPFAGESMGSVVLAICSRPLPVPSERGAVPHGFDAWFARTCARDVEARFGSARQAASEFLALSEAAGVSRSPATPRDPDGIAPSVLGQPALAPTQSTGLGTTTGQATSEAPARREQRGRRKVYLVPLLALLCVAGVVAVAASRRGVATPGPAGELRALLSSDAHQSAAPPAAASDAGVAAAREMSPALPASSPALPAEKAALEPSVARAVPPAAVASPLPREPAPARATAGAVPRKPPAPVPALPQPPVPPAHSASAHSAPARDLSKPAPATTRATEAGAAPRVRARVPAVPAADVDLGI